MLFRSEENARILLEREINRRKQVAAEKEAALARLQELFGLPRLPRRIECYDISHLQGEEPVASMVVFQDGQPTSKFYRRFRIRGVTGIDDYASLQEVVRRRILRGRQEEAEGATGSSFLPFPDLMVIDGGKGQLNAICAVLAELGFDAQPVISIAEKEEEIFIPGKENPFRLEKNDRALHLLQQIRDEAHRFALTFHRSRREKQGFASVLDRIKGIGPKRKKALLAKFGSPQKIREASLEDLLAVEGMTVSAARAVLEGLEEMK